MDYLRGDNTPPPGKIRVQTVLFLILLLLFQASDEDFETWNLEEYEPYEKKSGQIGLADMLMPYDKRGKTKFVRSKFHASLCLFLKVT